MKYCSTDTETTSIDPKNGLLLEVGMVVDDLENPLPLSELPRLSVLIDHEKIYGELGAISLHGKTGFWKYYNESDRYSNEEKESVLGHVPEATLMVRNFLEEHFGGERVTFAGKNFASFDLPWLKANFPKITRDYVGHRSIDVGFSYMKKDDVKVPNLQECLKRAGLNSDVAHFAVSDALDVVKLVRKEKLGYVEN